MEQSEVKKYIVVESYESSIIGGYKPGWRYEIFEDKAKIPQIYFVQDEKHAFWRFFAKSREGAEKQFLASARSGKEGLLWTYDREKM